MKVQSALSGILLVCLMLSSAQALTYFNSTFDTYVGHQAIYDLGYLGLETTIIVNISNTANSTGSSNMSALTVQLLNPTLASSNTPINNTGPPIQPCAATSTNNLVASYLCLTTAASGGNQRYFLRIGKDPSPTNDGYLQYYQVVVTSFFNTSNITNGTSSGSAQARTLFKGTEVLRDKVIKLLYFKDKGNVNISYYNPVNATFNMTINLWNVSAGTGSIYAPINSSSFLTPNVNITKLLNNVTNLTDTAFSVTRGYYMLTAQVLTLQKYVRLVFPSDPYTCPYNNNFPDYRQNFQPCLGSSSGGGGTTPTPIVPGYPCIVYDPTAGKCIQCATGFALSETGTCLYNTVCPPRQYYRFGVCYDVSSKCDTFDPFTGDCLTCISTLNYVVNGFCVPNPALIPNCTGRQYLLNNKCVDVSPLCKTFDSKTGGCTSCIEKYVLIVASASCFPRIVNCDVNQYLKDGECINYPLNCGNFDVSKQRCVACNIGYYPNNGGCEKIICATGKVPSKYGLFCIDVSPSCNQVGQYDTLTGDCLKCKNNGYTVRDGVCVQNTNPLSSCAARVSLGFSACPDAKVNCQFYNLVTGDCDQCFPGFFKDYTGVCSLRNDNTRCGGDEVSIQGYCIQKPANCRLVDNLGLCTTCNGNQYQLQNGQCIEVKRCASGQYLNPDNSCVNVPAGCNNGGFNPTTGVCLTCNDGKPAVNGLCCTGSLIAYQGQCITAAQYQSIYTSASSSEIPICITFHPTLGYCVQCNGNFQVDPTTMNSCI